MWVRFAEVRLHPIIRVEPEGYKFDMQSNLEIKDKCKFFLHGHYPFSTTEYFKELSESTIIGKDPDRYGQGSDLQKFEKELSDFFGFEDCIFLQSGTMAQLIALRIWSDQKNNSLVAFHPTCHLELHEQMAYKKLHNLDSTLVGKSDALINIDDLKKIDTSPGTILLELPQREIGGQLPQWSDLLNQTEYLRSRNIAIHLDGARVWECAPFYGRNYKEITGLFDSVYVSFYKGIGAVSGAALLGSAEFIEKARIWNRRHGGNLVTSFPVYSSAKHNFHKRINRFESYFAKTKEISEELSKISGIKINPKVPQVNMFHLIIEGEESQLRKKALEASKNTKIWGFARLQKVPNSSFCKFEWYVGDATIDLTTEEIVDYVKMVVAN